MSRSAGATPITIALALDADYVPWAATLVSSILTTHRDDSVDICVLHDGSIPMADQARLVGMAEPGSTITLHPMEIPDDLPTTAEFGRIVWLRFRIPEVLSQHRRALYLDADTFVKGSLRPLWETDLRGRPLGAVANVVEPDKRERLAELGIGYPGGYFNSGVLLLDLERLRSEGATDTMFDYARRHRDSLRWPDQEVLNAEFVGRWEPLHPRWNAQNSLWSWPEWSREVFGQAAMREAMTSPVIRHFEGMAFYKPWHYLYPLHDAEAYRQVLASTPWASTALVDITPVTRAIGALPRRARMPVYFRLLRWRARRQRRSAVEGQAGPVVQRPVVNGEFGS